MPTEAKELSLIPFQSWRGGVTALPSDEGLSKTGFVFTGWSEERDGDLLGESMVVSKNVLLYAKWKALGYSITYDLCGGSFPEGSSVPSSYTIDDEVVVSAIPEKDGCSFLGWKTESEAGHSTEAVIKKGSTGDVVFIAVWKTNEYTIRFELEGGTGDVPPIMAKNGESVTLPFGEGLSRAGYRFIGWSEEPNGKSVGESLTVSKDMVLYARWQSLMYRIVYDLDGGDFPTYVANPNYYTTDSGASMTLSPQKDGYEFLGWTEGDSSKLLETIALKKGSVGDRTFKANWKVVTYRITYDLDGGFINDGYGIDSYTIEDNDLRLPTPIKDGYWFMGWKNSDSSEPQVVYIVKQGSTGDLEVKAVWRKMHTIRYADGSNAETMVLDGDSFEVRECQPKTGYDFVKWIGSDGKEYIPGRTEKPSGDLVLTPQRKPIAYTITYLDDGEYEGEGNPTSYTIEDSFTLKSPTRQGSVFDGWEETGGSSSKDYRIEGRMGDLEITATWRGLYKYNILYDGNGGSNSLSPVEKTEGEPLILPSSGVERTGYKLAGWNTEADGSGDSYAPGGIYSKDKSCTFYAVWEAISYTIEYDLVGGDLEAGWPESYTIETEILIRPVPTRYRYIFTGWSEDGSKPDETISIAKGSTGNRVFKANWRPAKSYEIYYYGNGAEDKDYELVWKYEDENLNLMSAEDASKIFRKADYELVGWNTQPDGKGDSYKLGGIYTKNEECRFYAVWKAVEYSIKYDYNGATPKEGTEPSKTRYSVEELPLTLDSPELKNRVFIGWSLSGERVSKIPEGTTGDIVLTAAWELLPCYTITYDYDNGSDEVLKSTRYSDDPAFVIEECSKEKEGYVFSHWYSDDKTLYMPGSTYLEDADLKLHAYWVQECLKFELDPTDGIAWIVSYDSEYAGEVEALEIPALYKGKKVRYVSGFAWKSMTSLTVQEGVSQINVGAFEGCKSLVSVELPSNIVVRGQAFINCSAITTLKLSSGVQLNEFTFRNCTSLTKIIVEGDGVSFNISEGYESFSRCPIQEVDFGEAKWIWSPVPNGAKILVGGKEYKAPATE